VWSMVLYMVSPSPGVVAAYLPLSVVGLLLKVLSVTHRELLSTDSFLVRFEHIFLNALIYVVGDGISLTILDKYKFLRL